MAEDRELERVVKIAAPYDESVHSEVLLESVPVWFDLGWQKVDGEDYGLYADLEPASADTNPSYEFRQAVAADAPKNVLPPSKPQPTPNNPNPATPTP